MGCVKFSVFTVTFEIQVRDWLIRGVWGGINQSRARIVMDIVNTENCYVIYLLRIIDTQNILLYVFGHPFIINIFRSVILLWPPCAQLLNKIVRSNPLV